MWYKHKKKHFQIKLPLASCEQINSILINDTLNLDCFIWFNQTLQFKLVEPPASTESKRLTSWISINKFFSKILHSTTSKLECGFKPENKFIHKISSPKMICCKCVGKLQIIIKNIFIKLNQISTTQSSIHIHIRFMR